MAIIAGDANSAIASRKQMIRPPRMAGSASGSVTRRMVRQAPAPRMLAASSISDDTSSSAALVKMKMYGKEYSAMTTTRPGKL